MSDVISIRVVDLLIDEENPRLSQPNQGQRDAFRAIATRQGKKLVKLATDIVEYGINPSEAFIVLPTKDNPPRYTVLEGNRRLCALKALEGPEGLSGALPTSVLNALKKLSASYLKDPIETVGCVVFKTAEEAQHWLALRHMGENEGAGVVPWGAAETARFRGQQRGMYEPFKQALDFAEKHGQLTQHDLAQLHTTTFRRLIDTPVVRNKLGVTMKNKQLMIVGEPMKVAKAIAWVARDLISRNVSVGQVYDLDKRERYAKKIPATVIVKATGPGTPASTTSAARAKAGSSRTTAGARKRPVRDHLIPPDCVLIVRDARSREIEQELRHLSLREYTNAVAVLFRVFVELSVDWYVVDQGLPSHVQPKLADKLKAVGEHLLKRNKLTNQSIKPVRQAAVKGQYLGGSITLMNDYVHNGMMFPAAGDLRSHWNSLQPFMSAIWSP